MELVRGKEPGLAYFPFTLYGSRLVLPCPVPRGEKAGPPFLLWGHRSASQQRAPLGLAKASSQCAMVPTGCPAPQFSFCHGGLARLSPRTSMAPRH